MHLFGICSSTKVFDIYILKQNMLIFPDMFFFIKQNFLLITLTKLSHKILDYEDWIQKAKTQIKLPTKLDSNINIHTAPIIMILIITCHHLHQPTEMNHYLEPTTLPMKSLEIIYLSSYKLMTTLKHVMPNQKVNSIEDGFHLQQTHGTNNHNSV